MTVMWSWKRSVEQCLHNPVFNIRYRLITYQPHNLSLHLLWAIFWILPKMYPTKLSFFPLMMQPEIITQFWRSEPYPGMPPLSMLLASVTSLLHTSNCHLRRPRTPQCTRPVWIPTLMFTFTPITLRTSLWREQPFLYPLSSTNSKLWNSYMRARNHE